MGILKPATNEQAYLKMGLFGNAGSGKTTTACYLAMAIAQRLGSKKPVAVFETEAGSDFLVERFKLEGIELLRVKSHALQDLIEAAKEAEQTCSALIVDSITHVWQGVLDAKLAKVNEARAKKGLYKVEKLEFQHYSDIKTNWGKWTTIFLNSRIHIIVCGRAGNIWEYETNDETGKKELQKAGTKMKAEGEFSYEPSLLCELERIAKGNEPGAGWLHRCYVLKDRTDTINGAAFDFEKPRKQYKPGDWQNTFKPFKPVFDHLNIGGEHKTIDETRSSGDLFTSPDGESRGVQRAKRAEIAAEEVQAALVALWPGQDAASKKAKVDILDALFATRSWTAVENKSVEDLERGVGVLRRLEKMIKESGISPTEEEFRAMLSASMKEHTQITLEQDDLPESMGGAAKAA